ncbi:hypothetical protein C1646_676528 [Rhizophagus diaphanus]|nr:hypothetical protein C1646_676528 [Rhizophagus diaphanus] [Rhizophagus sp. MUCL 43196]
MTITLLCFVKENTLANTFPGDIEKDQLVGHFKETIKDKINVPAALNTFFRSQLGRIVVVYSATHTIFSGLCTTSKSITKAKRKRVLEDMGEQTFPEFYQTSERESQVSKPQVLVPVRDNNLRLPVLH